MGGGRAPCCDKSKVKKGPWSPAEDLRLTTFIQNHGHTNWRALPKQAGLLRCGKSCRLRWINYLRPDVKRGNFTTQEKLTIINLHNSFGNKWSKIASYLPGRTDNEIKNVWNTHLKKRLTKTSLADYSHKTEAKDKDSKTNYSPSPACASSSIALAGESNTEKVKIVGDPGLVQESEIKEPSEKSESLTVKSTNQDRQENSNSDSPTSSYGSSFSNSNQDNRRNKALEFSKSEVMNPDAGKIEIPLESDIDFWELFDSLHDLLPSDKTQENEQDSSPVEKPDTEIECSEWFRFLEDELGLTSDVNHLPKDQNIVQATPQYEHMNLEQDIGPGLEYFPIRPFSSQNLGI